MNTENKFNTASELETFVLKPMVKGMPKNQHFYMPNFTVYLRNTVVPFNGVTHRAIVISTINVKDEFQRQGVLTNFINLLTDLILKTSDITLLTVENVLEDEFCDALANKEFSLGDLNIQSHFSKYYPNGVNEGPYSLAMYVQRVPQMSKTKFLEPAKENYTKYLMHTIINSHSMETESNELAEIIARSMGGQILKKRLFAYGYHNIDDHVVVFLVTQIRTPAEAVMIAYDIAWYMHSKRLDTFSVDDLVNLYPEKVPTANSMSDYWDFTKSKSNVWRTDGNSLDNTNFWPIRV